jgi:hypothetical protein
VAFARRAGRPVLVVDLERGADLARIQAFLAEHDIHDLNVAGPRESEAPGIHDQAAALLRALLSATPGDDPVPG